MSTTRHGQVGLGAVGQHFARHLLARFGELVVHDLDPGRVAAACKAGATAAADAKALAGACDRILLSLPNPAAVMEVIGAPNGLLAGTSPGALVVDSSTIDPDTAREAAKLCAEAGVRYLEAPATSAAPGAGSTEGARVGKLTFLLGGEAEDVALAAPLLELLGERHLHIGPVGAGSVMKLVSNHISGIITLAVAEGVALAAAAGFPAERTLEVCRHSVADSYVMDHIVAPRLASGDYEPGFAVDLMHKDHLLAAKLGRELDVPLLFNQLAAETFQMMRAQGLGHRDHVLCVEFLAELAGVSLAGGKRARPELKSR